MKNIEIIGEPLGKSLKNMCLSWNQAGFLT